MLDHTFHLPTSISWISFASSIWTQSHCWFSWHLGSMDHYEQLITKIFKIPNDTQSFKNSFLSVHFKWVISIQCVFNAFSGIYRNVADSSEMRKRHWGKIWPERFVSAALVFFLCHSQVIEPWFWETGSHVFLLQRRKLFSALSSPGV